jgi:hypothetical protein
MHDMHDFDVGQVVQEREEILYIFHELVHVVQETSHGVIRVES